MPNKVFLLYVWQQIHLAKVNEKKRSSSMSNFEEKKEAFGRLLVIMDELREKCPWDMKQTMESLRHLSIEETFELSDAIMQNDMQEIKKELGDVLLHIVFYARIASEREAFDIAGVIDSLCEKLIRRHPHIYSDTIVANEEEVKSNWEKIKMQEGNRSALSGVPRSLPAMIKALRIQEKARGVGFDWEKPEQVWEKVMEELNEFKVEAERENQEKMEEEFGDLLFALINFSRFKHINPEDALEKTNRKFIHRFSHLEEEAAKAGKKLEDMTLAEMDVYWNQAKAIPMK